MSISYQTDSKLQSSYSPISSLNLNSSEDFFINQQRMNTNCSQHSIKYIKSTANKSRNDILNNCNFRMLNFILNWDLLFLYSFNVLLFFASIIIFKINFF
jgi:hypothetical protein